MKRFVIGILALFYLSTSAGATLHIHYCMGEPVEWSLLAKKGEICNHCGMEKNSKESKDCCKDEQKKIKLDKHDRTTESYVRLTKLSFQPIYIAPEELPRARISSVIQQDPLRNFPPGSKLIAVYLRHCVFRI